MLLDRVSVICNNYQEEKYKNKNNSKHPFAAINRSTLEHQDIVSDDEDLSYDIFQDFSENKLSWMYIHMLPFCRSLKVLVHG